MSDQYAELRKQANAAAVLVANFADILGDDEYAKSDLIEGETGLQEAVSTMMDRLAVIETLTAGLDEHKKKITARKQRLEKQADFIRTAIGSALSHADVTRIETPIGTVSVKAVPPSVVIIEEADLPSDYLKTEVKVDKAALLKELKGGAEIPGATLSNGGSTIQVRRT